MGWTHDLAREQTRYLGEDVGPPITGDPDWTTAIQDVYGPLLAPDLLAAFPEPERVAYGGAAAIGRLVRLGVRPYDVLSLAWARL